MTPVTGTQPHTDPAAGPDPGPDGQPDPGTGERADADPAAEFLSHRDLLFGVAYRMLGSVADAEDVVQDAWLAWSAADRAAVRAPRAYLVRTVTNLSLNRLTSARATRETYIGPWLPEPLLTAPETAETEEAAETADTVSTAMLVVLETLAPVERAVFMLHEVFGYSHAEIAMVLDRTEPAVRQIAYRARAHMRARRPRFDTDPARRHEVTSLFLDACAGGDLNAVMELLAPDVTAWSDGGGKVTAARRPLLGASATARWLLGVLGKLHRDGYEVHPEPAHINGELNILWTSAGHPVGVLSYDLADGVISGLRLQVNPDKLSGLRAAPVTPEP